MAFRTNTTKAAHAARFSGAGLKTMRNSINFGSIATVAATVMALFMGTQSSVAQVSSSSQTVIASTFGNAAGVGVDGLGNLYVADSATGVLSSLQGSNAAPTTLLSGFTTPGQVAFDTAGNAYVANGTSKQVVKIPYQSGSLNVSATTNLGTGLGTVTGVAVDLNGNVYIVDSTNKQVVKISGTTQTVLYSALTAPKQIAVDRLGDVYIADAGANSVVYLPVGGGAASTVGNGLNAPSGVATDAANDIYIADTGNGRVVEVLFGTTAPTTTQNVLTSSITAPSSVALDSRGGLYVTSGASVYRYTFGSLYFGLQPVATTSQTFPVTLSFTAALAPATIKVLTTGITGLDYKDAGNDTCVAGTSYSIGNTCTINVTFTPAGVGPRYGAIVLYAANNQVLARVFLGGGGLGPLITIDPGTLTTVTPTSTTAPAALYTPRGLTSDAGGNIFVADYDNNRILEIPAGQANPAAPSANLIVTSGTQSVAINGAGDLINATGSSSVIVYPFENGTWSTADAVTFAGYSKVRVVRTDVGGNIFYCDNGTNSIYETKIGGTPVKLATSAYAASCLGTAVDLYGNIAATDGTNGKILYVPVNGAMPYETGTSLTGTWGIAFDASGSVWVSSSSVKQLVRIPNEYGTLVGADQILATVGNTDLYDIWMDDASGTLYSTEAAGSTETTFYSTNRTNTTHAFTAATTTGTPFILSSSGNQPATYTNGGYISLYDIYDFPSITPASPACNFTLTFTTGFTCNLSYDFAPQSSGTPRTETIDFSSNAVINPVINLSGPSTLTTADTLTLTLTLTTPSSGVANPGQPLVVTATAKPSSTTVAATGALTFTIDGVATNSGVLSSNTATFTIPAGLALGTHTIGATYSGDKNYAPITTLQTVTINVVAATSTTTLVASASYVDVNENLVLTASVPTTTGLATPTGTVTFKNTTAGTTLGTVALTNGLADLTVSFAAAGSDVIQATYSGDKVYTGSTSGSVTVNVGTYTTTTTMLAVTPTQPTGGYIFGTVLTANIAVAPTTCTGSVDLFLDGAAISVGDALTNGSATLTLSSINAGAHTLVAYYSGSASCATSASSTSAFAVIKATTSTTLAVSPMGTFASVPVTLTATVTNVNVPAATPSGSVTFYSGATSLGTVALSGNTAKLTTTLIPVGTDNLTAVYSGDSNDFTSTSTATVDVVTIVPTTLSLVAVPSVIVSGGTSTLTATVVGTPVTGNFNGTVSFYLNGSTTAISTTNVASGGVASYTTTALTAPVTSYTACYSGNGVYTSSCSTTAVTVYVTDPNGAGVIATTTLGAGLSSSVGTAVDISGNLYISDATKGSVVLVAGGAGAQTTVASGLNAPTGLAVDGSGDLFVANGVAGQVSEYVNTAGVLSATPTQFGTGLGALTGVAVDTSGNLYVADGTNKQLVKITKAGVQTILSSTLINPQQVAVDSLGDVYVADGTGNRVVYIPVTGTATTVGTGLLNPTGVTVDVYNNVYISDTGNARVVKVPFVSGAPVTGSQATVITAVTTPGQLAVDRHIAFFISQAKSIYKWQADAASFGVLTPGGTSPTYTLTFTFATAITPASISILTNGAAGGEFAQASGSTCAAGTAYTAGQSCTVNVAFTPVTAGIRPGAVVFAATSGQPLLTAYLGGVLYAPALNFDTGVITKINPGGGTINGEGLATIRGVAADAFGNIDFCDYTNSRIIQTNLAGSSATVLATGISCGSVAIDGAGNVIVDDMGNSRMVLLPNENGTINGSDALVVATGFSGPRGMNLDGYGNIDVADTTNKRVVVAPIGGATTAQYVPTLSNVTNPYNVAIDWQGNIAVADDTLAETAYQPANGSKATTIGPVLCGNYALAMDGAGAVYATEISTGCSGTSTTGDDVVRVAPGSTFYETPVGHATSAEGISIDSQGNLYTAYGGDIVIVNRTLPAAVSLAGTAVGSTSAAVEEILTNGGPAPAVFTNPNGLFYVDSADFGLATGTTSPCNFSASLAAAYGCEFGVVFHPVQSGTRTAYFTPVSNAVNASLLEVTGVATGGSTSATTLTLTANPSGPLPNSSVTFTTGLSGGSGTYSGTISLTIDGVLFGQQAATATNSFPDPKGLSAGLHTVIATYSGDSSNTTSTVTLVVGAAGSTPSTTTLTITTTPATYGTTIPVLTAYNYTTACPQGTGQQAFYSCIPVTLTATVTGASGGSIPTTQVEFFDGTALLGSATLQAVGSVAKATLQLNPAVFPTGYFSQGTHNITAEYIGNLTYAVSVSPVVQLIAVYPGDYSLSLNPNSVTITAGQTAAVTITATPLGGLATGFYNGQIGLTCSGLPIYATCSVSPNSIYLDGTGAAGTANLNIITEAGFSKNSNPFSESRISLAILPAASFLLLLGAGTLRRRKNFARKVLARNLLFVLALAGLMSSLVACGSHLPLAPAPGTYTVTISGAGSGSVNHTVTMQVTIQK